MFFFQDYSIALRRLEKPSATAYLCPTVELAALKRLVREGEGLTLEFKRKARHPEKIAREVVAFANTQGGILLIGVEDDHTIYGCKFPDDEAFALTTFFDRYLFPSVPYEIERVPIDARRQVLVFHIPSSPQKPHFLLPYGDETHKTAFVRVADMSLKASREMVQVLRHQRRNYGVSIHFGEAERKILQYFESNGNITLAQTQKLLEISRRKTSELLVRLVRARILSIHPSKQGDYFQLKEGSFII